MSSLVSVTDEELEQFFSEAVGLVKVAGKVINEKINRDKKIEQKLSRTDLVTETDKAVEDLLCQGLKAKFPNHQFIGEESISEKAGVIETFGNEPTWIIDPIDGTMNFVHSNPMVSISVALAVNRKLVIGIIYLPVMDKLYTAIKGKGAQLNGESISVSKCVNLSEAMVVSEFDSFGTTPEKREILSNLLKNCMLHTHAVRWMGSAAIDMALVAAGQADLYFQVGIHCWDIAAGALIAKESGATVLDPSGKEFDFMSRRVLVAANEKLAEAFLAEKWKMLSFDPEFPDVCPM